MAQQIQLPWVVDENGEQRFLGRTLPPPSQMALMQGKGAKVNVPEALWQEFDLRDLNPPIKVKDQNGRGACNGFAAAEVIEWKRWLTGKGKDYIPLSGWYPYAILCQGVDRGSSIAEALTLSMKTGIAPEEFVNYGIINPNQLSDEAHAAAPRFRIGAGTPLRTFREMMSATQLRRPFNFSLQAKHRGFSQLDADGAIQEVAGTGDHAITGGIGAKKGRDGRWMILFQNHWTERYGDEGFAWFRETNIKGQRYMEAYEGEYILDDPQDPTNPLPPS